MYANNPSFLIACISGSFFTVSKSCRELPIPWAIPPAKLPRASPMASASPLTTPPAVPLSKFEATDPAPATTPITFKLLNSSCRSLNQLASRDFRGILAFMFSAEGLLVNPSDSVNSFIIMLSRSPPPENMPSSGVKESFNLEASSERLISIKILVILWRVKNQRRKHYTSKLLAILFSIFFLRSLVTTQGPSS